MENYNIAEMLDKKFFFLPKFLRDKIRFLIMIELLLR